VGGVALGFCVGVGLEWWLDFDVFAVEMLDERGRDGSEEEKEKKKYDECYLRRVVFLKSFVESFNTVGKAAALVIHVLCFVCKTQKSVRGR